MPKGVESNALQSYGNNSTTAANAASTAMPIYSQLASGTQGLTPQQKANELTASMQTNGGSTAAAVGLGNLMAARTGNVGGYGMEIDAAARQGGEQASQDALGVQNQDAAIARQKQDIGLRGLSSMYATATGAANGSLDAADRAPMGFWQQYLLNGEKAAAGAAAAAG